MGAEGIVAFIDLGPAKVLQGLIHDWRSDGALFNLDKAMAILGEETGDTVGHMDPDAVPITVGMGCGDAFLHGHLGQFADASEGLLDLCGFHFELFGVGNVLITTTSAFPEVRACGIDSVWRGEINAEQFRFSKVLFLPNDSGGNGFA